MGYESILHFPFAKRNRSFAPCVCVYFELMCVLCKMYRKRLKVGACIHYSQSVRLPRGQLIFFASFAIKQWRRRQRKRVFDQKRCSLNRKSESGAETINLQRLSTRLQTKQHFTFYCVCSKDCTSLYTRIKLSNRTPLRKNLNSLVKNEQTRRFFSARES